MKKLTFSISIQATPEQVWHALWDDTAYRQWTAVFHEGSHAVSNWNEGDRIEFLGPGGSGMYGLIHKKELNRQMVFQHLGELKNHEEQPMTDETKDWSGALESYTLHPDGANTILETSLDSVDAFLSYFEQTFPLAMDKVKQLAEGTLKPAITVFVTVDAPIAKTWECWTNPAHIKGWCFASDDWHAPNAENDLRVGGRFSTTMAAKDGSFAFDFGGIYTEVDPAKRIAYTLDDDRKVSINFSEKEGKTEVVETFEPEGENTHTLQRNGWQAILDNFKKHVEAHG